MFICPSVKWVLEHLAEAGEDQADRFLDPQAVQTNLKKGPTRGLFGRQNRASAELAIEVFAQKCGAQISRGGAKCVAKDHQTPGSILRSPILRGECL